MILINSSPKDALKIFQPFLPIFVPVGIGCLLAVAERDGIKVQFIDEQVKSDVLSLVDSYAKDMARPYIFGFSVLTAAFKNAIAVSRELKKRYPDSLIVFGGVHPTAMPEEVLAYEHIDLVLRGEGEKALFEFYRRAKTGKDFKDINNLSYKVNGRIVHNDMVPVTDSAYDSMQFPYHLFRPKNYDLGFVISSRGCPYSCIFCSNRVTTGRQYRFKSADAVVNELDMLHHKYKRKHVLFVDDNFLINEPRVYTLLEEIKKRRLHKEMVYSFQARGDNINDKLLKGLYAGGFRSIFFGLETASERLMKIIKKGETVEQCKNAVRLAKNAGFHVSATFIYGLPAETHKDRMDCAKLSRELKLDMVRYNNATPYPGTELYEMAKRENRLNVKGLYENFISVSTFIESPFKKIPFSYLPEGNTEKEIRDDILYSYLVFYRDLAKIKGILTKPERNVGWFNSGEKLDEICKKIPSLFLLWILLVLKFSKLFLSLLFKKVHHE